jgi:hypothetical protein
MQAVTSVTHAHKNNWAEVDIHHVYNLPVFNALFLAYYYTQFFRWLHNMDLRPLSRKQQTYIGKYSFVNRTIPNWNQLSADDLGTLSCKPSNFRKRFRKVINEAK